MTPTQLAQLRAELQNDPLSFGYPALLAAGALGAICDAMNAPTQSVVGELTAARAITWAASGPMAKIVDVSTSTDHPARASCLSFLQSLNSAMPIDMSNADVESMFAGWVAAGVIDQSQYNAAIAKATVAASRATVLNLPAVTVEDIHAAGV